MLELSDKSFFFIFGKCGYSLQCVQPYIYPNKRRLMIFSSNDQLLEGSIGYNHKWIKIFNNRHLNDSTELCVHYEQQHARPWCSPESIVSNIRACGLSNAPLSSQSLSLKCTRMWYIYLICHKTVHFSTDCIWSKEYLYTLNSSVFRKYDTSKQILISY